MKAEKIQINSRRLVEEAILKKSLAYQKM